MTEQTALDRTRRYLVPVARLQLPGQPDVVHFTVYRWVPKVQEWFTGLALCGYSTEGDALPDGTVVTCLDCLAMREGYERYLAPGYRPEDDDPEVESLRAELEDQRKAKQTAADAADRFRDVLSEVLGFPDENPGDDVLVAKLRTHFGKTGPEPTRWREFLAGAGAIRDQINAAARQAGKGPGR